jgi:hypothetical protein
MGTFGRLFPLTDNTDGTAVDQVKQQHLFISKELWGLSNCDIIERVHLKYCNHLLNLKSSTSNCVIHGEAGCCPLQIDIKKGMVAYWIKRIYYIALVPFAASVIIAF